MLLNCTVLALHQWFSTDANALAAYAVVCIVTVHVQCS
jgi:hypothetical protein